VRVRYKGIKNILNNNKKQLNYYYALVWTFSLYVKCILHKQGEIIGEIYIFAKKMKWVINYIHIISDKKLVLL
jgi:hypothetical protein